MSLYSPTEVTFREEIQKLREKFPDHILFKILELLSSYNAPQNFPYETECGTWDNRPM